LVNERVDALAREQANLEAKAGSSKCHKKSPAQRPV
jgi:hypothetical protein